MIDCIKWVYCQKYNFKPDVRQRKASVWFLEIAFVQELVCVCVCVHVCMCLCTCPRQLITSGVMWPNMDPDNWLNKFYSFYMVAVVGIISRCDLSIEAHCKNQPIKYKPVLYNLLLSF